MKKRLFASILALALSLSLVACGGSQSEAPASTPSSAPVEENTDVNPMLVTEPVTLRFASTGSGGDYTDIGSIVGFLSGDGILPDGSAITQDTISSGNSSSGYLIEAGQTDVCRGQNAIAATVGFNGRPPYSTVRALFSCGGTSACFQVTSKAFSDKTGYSTIEEIIENKYPANICSEDVGSSDYVLLNYIFDIYGIDAETFKSWGGSITYTGSDTASEMMQDGSCDIFCTATTLTSAVITELSMSIDVNINGFSDKIVDGLLERGFAERRIPAGTFNHFPEEGRTAYLGTSLIVSESMDEKVAYTLTKVLLENLDTLSETCTVLSNMEVDDAVNESVAVVPFHPGSIKYFQEIGLMDANGNPTV